MYALEQHSLGTPETRRRGRSTRKARKALKSVVFDTILSMTVDTSLKRVCHCRRLRPFLPDDHNGKVENVPSVAEVRVRMHCESIGDDF